MNVNNLEEDPYLCLLHPVSDETPLPFIKGETEKKSMYPSKYLSVYLYPSINISVYLIP